MTEQKNNSGNAFNKTLRLDDVVYDFKFIPGINGSKTLTQMMVTKDGKSQPFGLVDLHRETVEGSGKIRVEDFALVRLDNSDYSGILPSSFPAEVRDALAHNFESGIEAMGCEVNKERLTELLAEKVHPVLMITRTMESDGKTYGFSFYNDVPYVRVWNAGKAEGDYFLGAMEKLESGYLIGALESKAESAVGEDGISTPQLYKLEDSTYIKQDVEQLPNDIYAELVKGLERSLASRGLPSSLGHAQKTQNISTEEVDATYDRMMNGTDLDAEAAKAIAENRMDTLLDELNAAKEAGDDKAVERVNAQLKAAVSEQGQMDEAAEMLGKPKNHFAREDFEAKHAGDAVEGQMQEDGHVAKLKAQRAAEAEKGAEGRAQ